MLQSYRSLPTTAAMEITSVMASFHVSKFSGADTGHEIAIVEDGVTFAALAPVCIWLTEDDKDCRILGWSALRGLVVNAVYRVIVLGGRRFNRSLQEPLALLILYASG